MTNELRDEAWIVIEKRRDGSAAALVKTFDNRLHHDAKDAVKAHSTLGDLKKHFEVRRVEVIIKEAVVPVEQPLGVGGHAFAVAWTEREAGWGMRPDGYFLYPSAEVAKADTETRVARMRAREAEQGYGPGNPPPEYSAPGGDPCLVLVTNDILAELALHGWACRNSLPFDSQGKANKFYRPSFLTTPQG